MTPEELMKPRYKVIADYPKSLYHIGTIINAGTTSQDCIYCDHEGPRMRHYPHLFKPLEWWEERATEDMPQYVKVIHEGCAKDTGLYCKVHKWSVFDDIIPIIAGQYGAELEGYSPLYLSRTELNFPGQVYGRLNVFNLLPATSEEYEQYNKQNDND